MSALAKLGGSNPPLLGDDRKLSALHPKKLHEFFGWSEPWEHNLATIENNMTWLEKQGLPGLFGVVSNDNEAKPDRVGQVER